MYKRRSLAQNTIILFVSMMICKVLGAAFKIFLSNIIGGTGMGFYSTAYSLFSPVFAITAAGIPTVLVKLTANSVAKGDKRAVHETLKVALFTFGMIGLIGTAAVFAFAVPFADFIACSPESTLAIFLIAPSVFFCCISSVLKGYYEGLSDMAPSAVSNILESIVRTAAGIGMSYAVILYCEHMYGMGLDIFGNKVLSYSAAIRTAIPYAAAAAILSVTIGEILSALFLYLKYRLNRENNGYRRQINMSREQKKELACFLLKESFPIALCAVVVNLSSFIDLITIGRCINYGINADPSYYTSFFAKLLEQSEGKINAANFIYGSYSGLVMTVFMLVPSFTGMIGRGALPDISSLWATGNKAAFRNKISLVIRSNLIIGCPMFFGMAFFSKEILSLLFSGKEVEVSVSVLPLAILSFGGIFLTLSSTLYSVFQVIGRPDIPIKLMLISSAAKLTFNVFLMLIPELNISGAALSTVISYAAAAFGGVLAIESCTKTEISILKISAVPVISGILCSLFAKYVYNSIRSDINPMAAFGICAFIAAILYIFIMLITKCVDIKMIFKQKCKKSRF